MDPQDTTRFLRQRGGSNSHRQDKGTQSRTQQPYPHRHGPGGILFKAGEPAPANQR